ncbi:DUF202 domain-containing protein [Ideonella livida]|uniref:DUF202 domain-containing protein n=1 Tax=Ideonella livida TaxID=2707176 RepID=A0A7C9PKQ3_9BURK|nr:DUF202 domain-containing protein [Ideonella livida]NDY93806.1 DUF202 domain-containing protein [Ideonella livida]NDY93811.1 DUF202 domain-containing protein [Ideonella livida]
MSDPGLQPERTALAWQRTAWSMAVAAAVLLKVGAAGGHGPTLAAGAGLAVGAAGWTGAAVWRARALRRWRAWHQAEQPEQPEQPPATWAPAAAPATLMGTTALLAVGAACLCGLAVWL